MIIYACSPLRGDPPYTEDKMKRNLLITAEHCKDVMNAGHTPIAPHLYFNTFLNDRNPEERARGMEMGAELIAQCDEMWVFGNEISEGMKRDISEAEKIGKPVLYK